MYLRAIVCRSFALACPRSLLAMMLVWSGGVGAAAIDDPSATTTETRPGEVAEESPAETEDSFVDSLPNLADNPSTERDVPDWSVVRDKRPLSAEEGPLYYHLLHLARESDSREMQQAAETFRRTRWAEIGQPQGKPLDRFSTFVDLMRHPEAYRGQPVDLRGHTQDILRYEADSNPYGITTLYEAWLFTPDSQRNPTIVICTELPDDLAAHLQENQGRQLIGGIRATGYFLKHQAYRAEDTRIHFAPLILAHRLEWSPPQGTPMSLPQWVAGLTVAGILLLIAAGWRMSRRDAAFRQKMLNTTPEAVDLVRLDSGTEDQQSPSQS